MVRKNIILFSGFALVFLLIAFNLSFISSSYSFGNLSNDVAVKYAPGSSISGWINISLNEEPSDSLFKVGDKVITLIDLLSKNSFMAGIQYNCSTAECNLTYGVQGVGSFSKTFGLNTDESRIVGLKITEDSISSVNELIINISSNAQESCSGQLKIDLFDDGEYDWVADKKAGSYCSQSSNCFSSADKALTPISSSKVYCQTIFVNPAPGLRISANVSGVGDASFTLSVEGTEQSCSQNITGSGMIACDVNMSIINAQNITVCLMQDSGNSYNIYYEDKAPVCGFVGSSEHDFSIFAERQKYGNVGEIIFNSSEISGIDLLNYVENKYENCISGCYIPIRFYSGYLNQQIVLNNANLIYESKDIIKSSNNIYFLEKVPSKISMSMRKVNLDNVGFIAPLNSGFSNFTLYFKNEPIVTKTIEVLGIPIIYAISPMTVPAGVRTRFVVGASGINISGYSWDFGDNITIQTEKSFVSHKYSQLGSYVINVKVKNEEGESSRNFNVEVISPELVINSTIANFEKQIATINSQLKTFPSFVKTYLEKNLKLNEAEIQLQQAKTKLDYSGGNDTLSIIDIFNSLSDLNLPDSVIVESKSSGKFILDSEKVSQSDLSSFTGESSDADENSFKNAVYAWNSKYLDVSANLQIYSAVYDEVLTPLGSYVDFKLSPMADVEELYVIVNKEKANMEFPSGVVVKEAGSSSSVVLDLSEGQKNIELFFKDKVDFIDLPVYFSPLISKLQTGFDISPCNSNKVCEKDLGEDWKNCRIDCKPVGLTIFWLFILLIAFFVAYIFAQEWYKKKYEDYLFKDKNDLFNLIHFIENAEKQGLKQEAMFEKLKEKKWINEQIQYAYKKFKGQRTGMWEIPIMKFLENKKIFQQLELRRKLGMSPNVVPTPVKPFVRPGMPNGNNLPIRPMQVIFGNKPNMFQQKPMNSPVQKPSQDASQIKPTDKKPEGNKN